MQCRGLWRSNHIDAPDPQWDNQRLPPASCSGELMRRFFSACTWVPGSSSQMRVAFPAWSVLLGAGPLLAALALAGCTDAGIKHSAKGDAGPACVDHDHDGFGLNCALGRDCNDNDPKSTNECRICAHPDVGCPCSAGTQPISCFGQDETLANGNVMCREGTRFCRNGNWGQCEDIHGYVVTPDRSLTSLINPDAAPQNCSICDVKCFKVSDPLLSVDGGPGSGVTYSPSGGLQLAPADGGAGSGDGGDGGGAALTGCAGLTACCSTLDGSPALQGNCQLTASGGNDAECTSALQIYCPSIVGGPVAGCTLGGSSVDSDCDGIPDVLDECTADTIATNPDCNGSTLPLSTTNNQTIFHILDKGQTGSNALQIKFKVQNADVYFLLDTTDTMSGERDNLVASMTTGNVVECAMLKNCCDHQPDSPTQTACMNVVNGDNQSNCANAEATYCTGANAGLVHCPDLDFNGIPDDLDSNQLKSKGVVGAVRCLVGSSWFGAGYFREIPSAASPKLGDLDEHAFRHWVDMTPDVNKVRDAIGQFVTNGNSDYPEADLVGLYSLLTGKGQMFGNTSPSVPERLGLGCPANTFGYPCFRKGTIPIVVMFTDDPLHTNPAINPLTGVPYGIPGYAGGGSYNKLPYASNYAMNGKAPSSGVAQYTPTQAETFATAYNLGSINNQFAIASGNLRYMAGDYPAAVTGCGAATAAPEAVYRFTVDPLLSALGIPIGTPVNVKIAINTTVDGNSLAGAGPTPATDAPVVVSLFRGIPSTIQPPIDVGDTRVNPIASGPDLTYLTYTGTTSGTNSAQGFLGGISGCGADGKTNEVIYTFRPTVDAKVVIDSSQTGTTSSPFNSVISLHQGLPSSLPANPSGANQVALVGAAGNNNDTFSTARRVDGADMKIDGDYVTYIGDMVALQDSGSGSDYDVPSGKTGKDDYDSTVVACGVNSAGPDAVYKFTVGTARRVRIDTEGSNFHTVISLHDGPPPQSFVENGISGNDSAATNHRVGSSSGDSVTDTAYAERSDSSGTSSLADAVAPMCGGVSTTGSNDAFYSFRLTEPTHLNVSAAPRSFAAAAGQAYNTPGSANEAVSSNAPPASPGSEPIINEFVVDHAGADTHEFVEVYGQPNTNYAAYKILQIEGDLGSNPGNVNKAIVVGTTNGSGLWVSPFYSDQLENGTDTLLLVKDYTGTASSDIDADDDGVIDLPLLWSKVADAVAVSDGGAGDIVYGGATVLPSTLSGGSSTVGGASRIPSGKDTDSVSDWTRNDYSGDGLPGLGFDPMVFLYSSAPGSVTTVDAADPNGDGNTIDSNTHNTASSALNLGDVFGQVDTKVVNADLGNVNTTNDYGRGVVSCNGHSTTISAISTNTLTFASMSGYTPAVGDLVSNNGSTTLVVTAVSSTSAIVADASKFANGNAWFYPGPEPPGYADHVYKFTPSADGTVRVNAATSGGAYEAVAIYDGPPPISGAIGSVQLFDASKLTSSPDSSCTAYSFDADKTDSNPAHLYWFCANNRNWATAEANCNNQGGHLVRLDNAAENAFVGSHRTTTPAWTGAHDTGTNVWSWADNGDQFWSGGSGGSAVGGLFSSWRSGQPASSSYCVAYKTSNGGSINTWDSTRCSDSDQYACEMTAPSPAPPESLASAYAVGSEVGLNGNMVGKVLAYNGSTRRMDNDIDGLLMSSCGATQNASDAVFKITPSASIQATIDTSGSSFPAIVGLFHSTIDASGYVGCDAPGVAPNTDVTVGTNPASTLPLGGSTGVTLVGGETYYAVIKGTVSGPDGAYQIKFTDLGAGGDGVELACSKESALGPAAAETDFSANHTYYVIVESASTAGAGYAMTAHSLYRKRVQVENPLNQNEHGGTAFSLADPYRSKIQVVNTSTAGMAANYQTSGDPTTPMGLLTCGNASDTPDAVYKFTPSIDTNVRITAATPGDNAIVALFKGQPGSFPSVTDLDATGNTNENTSTAYQVNLAGPAQTLLGDTSLMTNDIDGSLLSCGASPSGRDATFKFSLSKTTQVQIDASASTQSGMMGDPVIALFHDGALEKPAPVTLENDTYTAANTNPSPTPAVNGTWLSYDADMSHLTPSTQAQVGVAATNTNEEVNPTTLQGAQDLGDIWNTKVTVGGATTSAMTANYAATGWCGGDDGAPDAIYSFYSSQGGPVHISTANPAPGFNTVIALYDGSTGAPLRKIDSATTTVDLNGASACGNGVIDWQEECDDGNTMAGDGCDATCHREAGVWRCPAAWYGTNDGCDCGCGAPDPDCGGDASSSACAHCDPPSLGGCNPSGSCPGVISAADNTACNAPVCGNGVVEPGEQCDDGNTTPGDGCDASCMWQAGSWTCDMALYGTGNGCDCGCGIHDPDCGAATDAASCQSCNAPGSCSTGACPGSVNATDNATCSSFGGGGNRNDTLAEAQDVKLSSGGVRRFLGNSSGLTQNVDASQIQCGAQAFAPDAIYHFSLRNTTKVKIDASASGNPPVLALFRSETLDNTVLAPIPLAPDNPSEADANPSPTPIIDNNWVRYSGDIANLTASNQPQSQINNQDNANNDTQTELYDPYNRRVTVVNADSSAASMQATFPAPSCGGADSSHDALYRFVPSQSGQVRISTNYPQTGFDSVVALYDGSKGAPPLTQAQSAVVTTAVGQSNESQPSALSVPLERGGTFVQTGNTTGMNSDINYTYFQQGGAQCGAAPASADAVWSFSLSKPTDVELSADGSGYGTVLGLFDSPFVRPSLTSQSSLADAITQIYDQDKLPGEPEAGCTAYDFNLHRYWLCTHKRPWDDARAKCQLAGGDLVVIDNQLENDTLYSQIAPTAEPYLIGLHAHVPYSSWGSPPSGDWVDGSSASFRNWASGEPNQPSDSPAARMRYQDGFWVDTPESWQSYRYICEQGSQPALPSVPTATSPQVVDVLGRSRHFVGSTAGTPSSVANLIGCGAQASAPDAAFKLTVPYITTVTLDFSNSFAGSVVGLFNGSIGAAGYVSCASVGDAAPQLQLTNLAPGTYYVVLTGTSSGLSGSYDLLFSGTTTDPAAFTMENDRLVDAVNNPIGDITNRWVVKKADMAHLGTDLITARTVDMVGVDTNSSHVSPNQVKDLGNTAGQQVSVVNASLSGLTHDYPAPTCGGDDDTADAIYKFTPTSSTTVRIGVQPSGFNPVLALYRGPDYPLLQSETPAAPVALPNTNDAPTTSGPTAAQDLGTIGDPVIYTGNLTGLNNDVPTVDAAGRTWDRSDLNGGDASNQCNAAPTGKDAFFSFTITPAEAPKTVVLESSNTAFAHTLAVWPSTAVIQAPMATTAENDTRAGASNLPVDNQWYVLQGNTSNLMPGGDAKVVKTAGTDFFNLDTTQDLGTLAADTQIVTSGADSTTATATYDTATLTCGAAPSAHDMIFKFHTGASGGATRLAVSNPSPAFPPVLALFDGTGGKVPQTAAASNPVPTPVTGNDSRTNAFTVPALGTAGVAYSGDTSTLSDSQGASLYNQAPMYGSATCNAGASSKDAFFYLDLLADAHVRIQTQSSTVNPHTIAIYNADVPLTLPAAVAAQYNTQALADAATPAATIDGNWLHYVADMSPAGGMGIGELSAERFFTAGTDFQNAASVQDLNAVAGTISGQQFRTKAAGSYAGGADTTYSGATYLAPSCGVGNSTANDMIWKVRPTTNTKLRIGVDNPAVSWSPMLAVYDGAPLTSAESSTTPIDLNTSSNPNETFSSSGTPTVVVGPRTRISGDEGSMSSDYASTQFQAFQLNAAPKCSPGEPGADAFVKLKVRTVPDGVTPYEQIWLDAADAGAFALATGAVSNWADEGPNAHNATQSTAANEPSRMLASGTYTVELNPGGDIDPANNATEDYLDYAFASGQDSPVSVFAVWRLLSTNFLAGSAVVTTDVGGAGFGLSMSADGSTNTAVLNYADSSGTGVAMTGALSGATGPMLSEVTHDSSGAIATYLNGNLVASGSGRAGGTQYRHIRVGTDQSHSLGLPMDLYELIVVGRAVTPSERQTIEGYLAAKWGLQSSLPGGHPYQSAAPTRSVEVSSANTSFAHTVSLFSAVPMTEPAPTAGPAFDTSDSAQSSGNPMGVVNGSWLVRSASGAGMHISELNQVSGTAAGDGSTQGLGSLVGNEIGVSGGSATTSGYQGDYPATCGSLDDAPDAIYQITPATTTTAHIALRNPGFVGNVALFEAPASAPTATPATRGQLGLYAAPTQLNVAPSAAPNESVATAQTVASLYPITPTGGSYTGYAVGYTGDPITSNVAGNAFDLASAPGTCSPATTNGEDAFFKLTVPNDGVQHEIEINGEGSGGYHTLALFDHNPGAPDKPAVTLGSFASNVDTTALSFSGAPSWTCSGGSTTITSGTDGNGTGAAISSTTCTGGSPTPVIMSQSSGGPKVMVIKLQGLSVSGGHVMTLKGALPVVFLVGGSPGTVSLGGGAGTTIISADSQGNGSSVRGAGGSYSSCGASEGNAGANDGAADKGAGGGGGGAFRTQGRAGGDGDNTAVGLGGASSTADTSSAAASLQPLRGGCKGGDGATTGSTGGAGGGAFQISAVNGVTLNSGIVLTAAGGAGQHGSSEEDGGGGGGSGGAVLLEGMTITENVAFTAVSYTNGGGGGAGNQTDGSGATSGQDGQRSSTQANGGTGVNGGGAGGKGGATGGAASSGGAGGSYTSGSYQKQITINGSQVPSALTNFPVMVKITNDNDLKTHALANGSDIYFVASDQVTQLDYERESYDSSTGTLVAWVRIPSLASGTDTVIYLRYGDGGADRSNKHGVWDSSYYGVWHMTDGGDSTSNSHNGTLHNTSNGTGQIGGDQVFSSGDFVQTSNYGSSESTFSLWLNLNTGSPSDNGPMEPIDAAPSGYLQPPGAEMAVGASGALGIYINGGFTYGSPRIYVPNGSWAHVVERVHAASSGGYVEFSVNGSAFTRIYSGNTSSESTSGSLLFGKWAGGCGSYGYPICFAGSMDEIHVSTSLRSDAWGQAEYNNQKSSSTFITIGSEVPPSPKRGGGGGGGGGGQGYVVKNIISSPIYTADSSAAALTGSSPGPFSAIDNDWTLKVTDLSSMTASWATLNARSESMYSGFGESASSPINLPDPSNARITIDGNNGARVSNHNENVCGTDGGADTVYTFTPSQSGAMRVKVAGSGGTPISSPIVAVYDKFFATGYFHGCSALACVTDNDSDTSLPGQQGQTDSDAATGTTTITDLQVTAGTTYYLVVKSGGSPIVNGTYNLELTWRDPVDWPGCNEDRYGGKDVWYAFTTASTVAAGGESYTIETQNSTADTAIALYKDTNGDNTYQSSEYLTCADEVSGYASITTTPVYPNTTYYVRVKQPAGGSSTGNVILGVRDDNGVQNTEPAAIACSDGTNAAPGYAKIVATLDPGGTYYVGWKGGRGGASPQTYTGAYQVNFRDNKALPVSAAQVACATASSGGTASFDATLQGGRNYYVMVKGDGSGDSGGYSLDVADTSAVPSMSCAGKTAAPGAPDVYEAFSVSGSNKDVTLDMNGSTLDGVYELWQDNGASPDTKIGCAATTGATTFGSQLTPGNYYVKIRGTSAAGAAAEQPFQLSVRDDDVQRAADCSDGLATAGTTLTKSLTAGTYYVGLKPQSGPSASTYQLSVRDAAYSQSGGTEAACANGKTLDLNVSANHDYYVLVKGASPSEKGAYGLTVTDIGALDPTASSYDTRTDIGCGADLAAPDDYYEFTVSSVPKRVQVSLTGFSGAFQLYRDDGSFTPDDAILGCSASSQTYTLTTAGKYFLVVKGLSVAGGAAEGSPDISLRDLDAVGSIACADGTSVTPAVLQSSSLPAAALNASGQLKAGHYYVAVSDQQGSPDGVYALQLNDQDQSGAVAAPVIECTTGMAMTHTLAANTDYYAVVKGDGPPNQGTFTLSVTDVSGVQAIDAACPTDLSAPDGYAAFTLTSGPRDVRIDMSGSSLTGAFQVFDNSGAAVGSCPCSSISTAETCNLSSGTYYVVFRGNNLAGGNAQRPFKLVLQDLSALGSLACADGPISTGATLTTPPLGAGTYYAGIIPTKTNSSTDLSYRLTVKDSASVAVSGAPEIACNTSQIDASVNANESYYVVVKGKNVGDEGDYGLTIQDLSGVPSFGCGDDTTSGDAFYSFDVTAAGGSTVTIDSQGSSLQTVLALFPSTASFGTDVRNNATQVCCNPVNAGQPTGACNPVASCDGKPDDMVACDSSSGVGGSSLIGGVHLNPGTYYVVVRARAGAPDNKLPFNISVRDDGGVPSSYCAATTDVATGQARIHQVLQPGTYWVALKGSSSFSPTDGDYSLRMRDYAPFANAATQIACDTATDTIYQNVTAGNPYYVVVKGDTSGASGQGPYKLTVENMQATTGMGCNADPQSPDAFYRFSLSAPTQVTIDTDKSVLDTVIALYNVGVSYFGTNYAHDVNGNPVPCDDDSGPFAGGSPGSSRISSMLPAGDYYVEVKGKVGTGAAWGDASKPFDLSIKDQNANANIACAPASAPTITQTLPAGDYKLVVSDDGTGGPYDLSFEDLSASTSAATKVACDTANDTIDYTVAANTPYYVIVKGDGSSSAKGNYTLNVESVDGTSSNMGCGADSMSPDAFFKFNVTQQSDVTVDTTGSALDTVLALYPGNATVFGTNYAKDAFAQTIGCDDNGGGGTDSKISATLAPGTYYAVVKGATAAWGQSSLPFNLSIRDNSATQAITCADAGSGATITQTLPAGDYVAVLSDTDAIGSGGSGGPYSITFKDLVASSQESGMEIGCALSTLDGGGSGIPVTGGQDYYVVVKGNDTGDEGPYELSVDDLISNQAAAGSTPIACAAAGSSIDATYPAGDYYAVVTGAASTNGPYELQVKDVDPFLDYNRLACDKDSGPNGTSVIEADLQPGTHYVVVKGDGPGQSGTYQLNVRDVTANPDNRIACADPGASDRIEADVKAGVDYTVLLKGDARGEQGSYNLKLYDELGLQSGGGQLLSCQTICPNVPPYNSCRPLGDSCGSNGQCCSGKCTSSKCAGTDPAGSQACRSSELTTNSFTQSLAADNYYLTVKGRKANEKGFYELQVGDPAHGTSPKYVPPDWPQVHDALLQTGTKVLPVLSCAAGSNGGRCDGAATQLKVISQASGAIDATNGQGLLRYINSNGTGIGSGLSMAVRDLANYLAMDITLSVVNNPGFTITIQKCTNSADPNQAQCQSFSQGCSDTSPAPKNTVAQCAPGATPQFFVQFTNPLDPNAVPPNTADPNGGYHFKLQIVGNHQYLLDEIPVYIIPTDKMGPPPPSVGAGTYMTSGTYEQQVYGAGCNYYQIEGEGTAPDSCTDGVDNNGDGTIDADDPGCNPGSCLDTVDNDKDGKADLLDPDCTTNETQDWTDLFFKADIPPGTSIGFDVCTGDTPGDLSSCTYSHVATVTSATGACATNADCKNITVNGALTDGFCGAGGQCQFISPPKLSGFCTADAQCPNGSLNGDIVASYCKTSANQCQYTTPPADIGGNLMQGQNGKPYVKMKVTLNANSDGSASPTLYDWFLEYVCRGNL